MTKADQRYYAAERRRNARKAWNRRWIEHRKQAMITWKQDHPEGITQDNLKAYQQFMKDADKIFRQQNP